MQPVQIKIIGKKNLFIKWNDGKESMISLEKLRKFCPCAICLSEREKQSKTFIPILMESQVKVAEIKPVGSYAVSVVWKDGHSTGIYEYPYLRKLAAE